MTLRPRTMKILRDVRLSLGRVAVMTVAIAVAVTGFAAILIAKESLTRDATAAYANTNPAAATLDLPEGIDAALLSEIQGLAGVDDAAARQVVSTRVLLDGEWLPMRLFVIPDGDPLRIAQFELETGSWPVPADSLVLERAASTLLGVQLGNDLVVEGASGERRTVSVGGTVWDPALPPATQERTGYAFVSPATIESLGFEIHSDQLLITAADADGEPTRDQATVDAAAASVAGWLTDQGVAVHEVTAPPFRHPHQNQTDTVTNLLVAFALAALVLSAILVASTLGGMLAAQTRQIGIMKTVGASTRTLVALYVAMTASIAVVATAIGFGPGVAAGNGLADLVASILNLDLTGAPPSPVVVTLIIAAGVVVPVAVGLFPIMRAARVTVREAISDFETSATGTRRVDRLLSRWGRGDRVGVFAARNLLRRPQRFVATVALLGAGGALFLAGINSSEAWQRWVDDGLSRRSYDAHLVFAGPVSEADVAAALETVPGVTNWQMLASLPATPADGSGGVRIQRIYPDGGHGVFIATAVDPESELVEIALRDGHWLDGTPSTVVLNQAAATRLDNPEIGSTATLSLEGTTVEWTIVGVIDEVGAPATAYVATGGLDAALGSTNTATAVDIVAGDDTAATIVATQRALADAGIVVAGTVPTTELRSAIDNHVVVFVAVLIALAVLMAIIGALGLASAMSMSVIERTREYGVMKAIGATGGFVRRLVLSEAVMTGAVGFVIAALASVPVSMLVGTTLGQLAFSVPLPLVVSGGAIAVWALVAIVGAALASSAAASRSARLTVRESLAHQ